MQNIIYIALILMFLILCGISYQLHEIHEELFEMRHPKMRNDTLEADYLGKHDD